jgi:hypothetical protein
LSSEPLLVTFDLAAAGAAVTLSKMVFFIKRVSLPKTHPPFTSQAANEGAPLALNNSRQ